MSRLKAIIDLLGLQQLARVGIDHEYLAWPDTTLGDDIFITIAVGAHFRGQGNKAVLGGHPARRAEAIAVEQADCVTTIGQHDTGRSVPGLHVHGVIFVEGLQVRVHRLYVLPGRRYQHAQRTGHIDPTGEQHVEHVIQAGRIRASPVYQRCDIANIGQLVGIECRCSGFRPVAVAIYRIDLTVVRQQTERLCQRPTRHGIGRKPLVKHADCRG